MNWAEQLDAFCRAGELPVISFKFSDEEAPELDVLSPSERATFASLRTGDSKLRFYRGRWLIRNVLRQQLGCVASDVPLTIDSRGKPHCEEPTAFSFNISHSGKHVVAAFSNTGKVGVDIEDVGRRTNVEGIADRFFSPAEQAWVQEKGRDGFFEVWTRKEALVKATGDGLRGPWSELDTLGTHYDEQWRFHSFRICGDVQLSLACEPNAGNVQAYRLLQSLELESL